MKAIYPAIVHQEDGGYWVDFPDLAGCYTQGDTLEEVVSNAQESLAGYCVTLLEEKTPLPKPSSIVSVEVPEDSFASLIIAELIPKSKAVKKTLTIPSWLNDIAEEHHVNFSGVLQDALVKELNLI